MLLLTSHYIPRNILNDLFFLMLTERGNSSKLTAISLTRLSRYRGLNGNPLMWGKGRHFIKAHPSSSGLCRGSQFVIVIAWRAETRPISIKSEWSMLKAKA